MSGFSGFMQAAQPTVSHGPVETACDPVSPIELIRQRITSMESATRDLAVKAECAVSAVVGSSGATRNASYPGTPAASASQQESFCHHVSRSLSYIENELACIAATLERLS